MVENRWNAPNMASSHQPVGYRQVSCLLDRACPQKKVLDTNCFFWFNQWPTFRPQMLSWGHLPLFPTQSSYPGLPSAYSIKKGTWDLLWPLLWEPWHRWEIHRNSWWRYCRGTFGHTRKVACTKDCRRPHSLPNHRDEESIAPSGRWLLPQVPQRSWPQFQCTATPSNQRVMVEYADLTFDFTQSAVWQDFFS